METYSLEFIDPSAVVVGPHRERRGIDDAYPNAVAGNEGGETKARRAGADDDGVESRAIGGFDRWEMVDVQSCWRWTGVEMEEVSELAAVETNLRGFSWRSGEFE